tara:strand:- start:1201 stop:1512 length:312 start_codon:yes stop_codon:yes gene_type:complete
MKGYTNMGDLKNLTGKEVNSGVEEDVGGTMLTGAGIDFYRLLTIRQALQAQCRGFRLSNKIPQGTTLARRHLGLKGNKESLLEQVTEIIDRIQTERSADSGAL